MKHDFACKNIWGKWRIPLRAELAYVSNLRSGLNVVDFKVALMTDKKIYVTKPFLPPLEEFIPVFAEYLG